LDGAFAVLDELPRSERGKGSLDIVDVVIGTTVTVEAVLEFL
jgi:hypothetical protein